MDAGLERARHVRVRAWHVRGNIYTKNGKSLNVNLQEKLHEINPPLHL